MNRLRWYAMGSFVAFWLSYFFRDYTVLELFVPLFWSWIYVIWFGLVLMPWLSILKFFAIIILFVLSIFGLTEIFEKEK